MIHIQVDEPYRAAAPEEALRAAAQAALVHIGAMSGSELSILVTGDEQLRQLNAQHRQQDRVTDVLSFPSQDQNPESGAPYLGDIAIAFPTAERQAAQAGHPLEAELQLLVVHGVLHLSGYDHAEEAEKAAMWQAQRAILDQIGLDIGWEHAEEGHS